MRTLVLGLGKSGKATYALLEGDEVVGFDDNAALMEEFIREGKKVESCPNLDRFDRVVVSPGVPRSHPLYVAAVKQGLEVIGEAELALQRLRQPCIAVTGTNGKTTVTLLIEHVLKASGQRAIALGNVGTPLTAYVNRANSEEIMVVELSSYQLETLNTPCIDLGLILNITPDHLDRYDSMREYAKAKCRLQEVIKSSGALWVHRGVAEEFEDLLKPGFQIYGVESILPSPYTSLRKHDQDNAIAAWIACRAFGVSGAAFSSGLETFRKPAHRLEFVASPSGVDYFDDSKGTNIDATMKAVEAMTKPVILIVGGVDKGASYEPWKKVFAGKVKHILALGEAAPKIAQDLSPEFQVERVPALKEAVIRASEEAKVGDVVILSPGCSSYDMFRDYVERGEKFKQFVLELGRER